MRASASDVDMTGQAGEANGNNKTAFHTARVAPAIAVRDAFGGAGGGTGEPTAGYLLLAGSFMWAFVQYWAWHKLSCMSAIKWAWHFWMLGSVEYSDIVHISHPRLYRVGILFSTLLIHGQLALNCGVLLRTFLFVLDRLVYKRLGLRVKN